jgi:hypothetical protein
LEPIAVALARTPQLPELLSLHACITILTGNAKSIRLLGGSLLRLALMSRPGSVCLNQSPEDWNSPPRPERKVRRRRVPNIAPELVDQAPFRKRISIHECVEIARHLVQCGATPVALVDSFQAMSHLPWGVSQTLLLRENLLSRAIAGEHLEAVIHARTFRSFWADANETWNAAVTIGQIQPFAGDWGIVEHG